MTSPAEAGWSTQKVTVLATVSITGHTSWVFLPCNNAVDVFFARCTKGILFTLRQAGPWTRVNKMALTFGTLLSSQGADAHRQDPFGPIGGNPSYATRSVARGQTRPALPRLPLGRGGSRRAWCLVLGGKHSPGATRPSPLGVARSRGSVPRTRRTLVSSRSQCKSPCDTHLAQCLRQFRPPRTARHREVDRV